MDWEDSKDNKEIMDYGWQITGWTQSPRHRDVTRGAWKLGYKTPHSVGHSVSQAEIKYISFSPEGLSSLQMTILLPLRENSFCPT